MRLALRTAVCAAALSVMSSHAYAQAWTDAAGHGQAILSGSYYAAGHYWDNRGDRQSQPTYSKYELAPYLEYGLTDSITVGADLSLQRAHQIGSNQTNWGLGDSEFFLRKRLWQRGGFVLSAEPMIKLPSPESGDAQPRLGGSHPDAGLGLAGGYGFDAWGGHHFAELGAQYRYRFGRPQNQVNIDGTLGIGVAPRWTLMPQAFLTLRTASPNIATFTQSSADDYNLLKLQMSAVYKVSDTLSLQFGGFRDVAGKNVGEGAGVLFAVWKNF